MSMTQKQINQAGSIPTEKYFEIYSTDEGYCFPWLNDNGETGNIHTTAVRFSHADIARIFSGKFHLLTRLGDSHRGVDIRCYWSDGYHRSLTKDDWEIAIRPKTSLMKSGGV
jgi:hypothetical protein